jgi:ankyrin repeat protein
LLARGADLQEVNNHQTPLMHALMHGSVEVANLFLDKGAKKEQSFDFCGCTVRE